jgi:hypothetical protein
MTGYAVDRTGGTVTRIDPATFGTGPPVRVIEGASGAVSIHTSEDAIYVLDEDRGRVAVVEPDDVQDLRGSVRSVAEPVRSGVVDGDGRLWLLGGSTGDLVWFEGSERHDRPAVVDEPTGAELVVAGGRPAVVDPAARAVTRVGSGGGLGAEACIDIDPGDPTVRFAGSEDARVFVVSGEDGLLRVSDLGGGECGDVALAVADPGSDLGRPQEVAGRVLVPNFTAGTVAVVDLEAESVTETGELVTPGTEFELIGEDGIAYYNVPGSEVAGVVHLDGTFSAVAKYDPGNPGQGVEPAGGRDNPTPLSEPEDDQDDGVGDGPDDNDDDGPGGDEDGDDPDDPDGPDGPDDRDGSDDPDDPDRTDDTRPERPDEDPDDTTDPTGPDDTTDPTDPGDTTETTDPVVPAPVLSAITANRPPPYDVGSTQGFRVEVSGEFTTCTWRIAGTPAACTPGAGNGTTTVAGQGSFPTAGTATVTVTVDGPGGRDTRSRNVEVREPPPPPPPPVEGTTWIMQSFTDGGGTVNMTGLGGDLLINEFGLTLDAACDRIRAADVTVAASSITASATSRTATGLGCSPAQVDAGRRVRILVGENAQGLPIDPITFGMTRSGDTLRLTRPGGNLLFQAG